MIRKEKVFPLSSAHWIKHIEGFLYYNVPSHCDSFVFPQPSKIYDGKGASIEILKKKYVLFFLTILTKFQLELVMWE